MVETTLDTYSDCFKAQLGFKPKGKETLEVIMTRLLYMTQTGHFTIPSPQTLINWLGADATVNMQKVERMREGIDEMMRAMKRPEARIDGDRENSYSVCSVICANDRYLTNSLASSGRYHRL